MVMLTSELIDKLRETMSNYSVTNRTKHLDIFKQGKLFIQIHFISHAQITFKLYSAGKTRESIEFKRKRSERC